MITHLNREDNIYIYIEWSCHSIGVSHAFCVLLLLHYSLIWIFYVLLVASPEKLNLNSQ